MSDNVAITAGVGTSIATEDCGGTQVQSVKRSFGSYGKHHINIQRAQFSVNTNGDNDIIAAVALKFIFVYGFILWAVGGAVNVKWKDGAATDFHSALPLTGIGASWMLPRDGRPWFESAVVNTKLVLNLSAGVSVAGIIYYAQEP